MQSQWRQSGNEYHGYGWRGALTDIVIYIHYWNYPNFFYLSLKYSLQIFYILFFISLQHVELGSLDVPDVFIVCFSLVDRDSLESVLNFWIPKIQSQGKDTPIVLIGTQLDKRRSQRKGHVATEEGLSIAQTLCASAYVECSAKENIGVDVALYSILLASNMCRRKSGLFKRVLGR